MHMIASIRHKGLRRFYETGNAKGLPVQNHDKVRRILAALDAAVEAEDMDLPGFFFHGLLGEPKRYSVRVTANYRITFGWQEVYAIEVDIEDYH